MSIKNLNKDVEAQKYMMCVGDGGKLCEDLSSCEMSSPCISYYKLGLIHYNQLKAMTSLNHQIKLLQVRFLLQKGNSGAARGGNWRREEFSGNSLRKRVKGLNQNPGMQ